MHEKLLEMFDELLDILHEDERTDSDDHYDIDYFEDEGLAEEFEYKLDKALDYLERYSMDVSSAVQELIGSGVSYETCLETALELLVKA
jgi:acyl-CoA hydrolase